MQRAVGDRVGAACGAASVRSWTASENSIATRRRQRPIHGPHRHLGSTAARCCGRRAWAWPAGWGRDRSGGGRRRAGRVWPRLAVSAVCRTADAQKAWKALLAPATAPAWHARQTRSHHPPRTAGADVVGAHRRRARHSGRRRPVRSATEHGRPGSPRRPRRWLSADPRRPAGPSGKI